MPDRIDDWMAEWLSSNQNFIGTPSEVAPDWQAVALAQACVSAARLSGISEQELDERYGDLPAYMHERFVLEAASPEPAP